jgi:hypothetical protein
MRSVKWVVVVACVIVGDACGGPAPPPYRPVADVKQLMQSIVDPAADVVWLSVGTVMTEGRVDEIAPKSVEEWDHVRNAAWVLTESGNLLMMGSRAKDTGDWMKWSQQLIDVGQKAVRMAEARDKEGTFTVGGEIYDVCTNCHAEYNIDLRKPAGTQ